MRYSKIKLSDSSNGSGVRVSIFLSGCRRHCKGCFNREAWSFDAGEAYTEETTKFILTRLAHERISGLSVLGGEPLEPENWSKLAELLTEAKLLFPEKAVWLFTGYDYQEVGALMQQEPVLCELLAHVDVLKCGPFVEAEHEAGLLFRGSRNQQLIDLNKTRKEARLVFWSES